MAARHEALLCACAMLAVFAARASTHPDDEAAGAGTPTIARHAIAGGGGRSEGAGFAVHGTIGQADVDPLQPASGGSFDVVGGFWHRGGDVVTDRIFADGFDD